MVPPPRRLSPRRRADPRHGDRRPATAAPRATPVRTTTPNARAEPGSTAQPPRQFAGHTARCRDARSCPTSALACAHQNNDLRSIVEASPRSGGAGWRPGRVHGQAVGADPAIRQSSTPAWKGIRQPSPTPQIPSREPLASHGDRATRRGVRRDVNGHDEVEAPRPRRSNGSTPSRRPIVDHRRAPVYTSTLTGSRGKADRVAFVNGCLTNSFAVGDKADLVSEAQRVLLSTATSRRSPRPRARSTASAPSDAPTFGPTWRPSRCRRSSSTATPTPSRPSRRAASAPTRPSPAASSSSLIPPPHGLNVTHADIFNWAPVDFLAT